MPAVGSLREKIDLQARGEQTGFVQSLSDWVDVVANRSARIKPTSQMDEMLIADRLKGVSDFVITIRCSNDVSSVDTNYRVKNSRSGQIYNIRHVLVDEKDRHIYLACNIGIDEGC